MPGNFSYFARRPALALKCAKVRGTLCSRFNACKRLAGFPRVCTTSLGPLQSAKKLIPLWASACACAAHDLKCAKIRGTLSLRSNACKRLAGLPRVCRKNLGRFQSARKLFPLWAFECACAGHDLRCAKVWGILSSRSNACKKTRRLAQSLQNKFRPILKF